MVATKVDVIDILLVEDNPGDRRLTAEALKEARIGNELHAVNDGAAAIAFLRRQGEYVDAPRPGLVLLDLNLPKMDGREVLREIKQDPGLKSIPVVILTTSEAAQDISNTYEAHANCYITKPVDFEQFMNVVRSIQDFWVTVVQLPVKP